MTRVLVVDDSAYNRQTITRMLEGAPGIEVVGRAADGEEALAKVLELAPDVLTLDLEMPRMDGFSFLRILMAQRPTPVVVVSGQSSRESVLKALELGAYDFVAKPSRQRTAALATIEDELRRKIAMVSQLRMSALVDHARRRVTAAEPVRSSSKRAAHVVAIGASTGGPAAIQQILAAFPARQDVSVLVTQHMPPRFTTTFADRLARTTTWQATEAKGGEALTGGRVYVAPGASTLLVDDDVLRVVDGRPGDLFTPSVDRMLESAASLGSRLIAIILTGMGADGVRGALAVRAAGGRVLAESEESAVVYGMPREVAAAGACDEIVALGGMAHVLTRLVAGK